MNLQGKTEQWLKPKYDIGILLLRVFIGLRLLYGVVDNIVSWERMIEFSDFLQSSGFPFPTISAVTSVYAQLFCGLFILLGYKIRLASVILIGNFAIALVMVHLDDTVEGMTPALAMLFGGLTFLFCGAGRISINTFDRNRNKGNGNSDY